MKLPFEIQDLILHLHFSQRWSVSFHQFFSCKQKKKKRRVTRRQKAGHKSSSGRKLAVATPAIFYTPMWFTNLSCLFRISRRYVWRYYSLLSLSLNKLGKYYPKTSQAKAVCLHRSLSSLKGLKHWGRTEEGGGARTCGFLHNFSCT